MNFKKGSEVVVVSKVVPDNEIIPCCCELWDGLYTICCTSEDHEYAVAPIVDRMNFEKARLFIKKIVASNVKNVHEVIGKNDLYVDISYGKVLHERTKVLNDTGANGEWDFSDKMVVDVSSKMLKSEKLRLTVNDKSKIMGPDKLIGEGTVSLSPILDAGFEREKIITLPVLGSDKKQSGTLVVTVLLKPSK